MPCPATAGTGYIILYISVQLRDRRSKQTKKKHAEDFFNVQKLGTATVATISVSIKDTARNKTKKQN